MSSTSREDSSHKTIEVVIDGPVAVVTMSRPEAFNAWTEDMRVELMNVYATLEKDPSVRVIVLTGDPAGKAFCAGADLKRANFSDPQAETDARDGGGQFALTVHRSHKITIAAINGNAAGVGITQTLPMDLVGSSNCVVLYFLLTDPQRFAWAGAKIVFPFTRRGIVPEATSSYFLPQLIGRSKALAVFILASSTLLASSPLLSGLFAHLLPTKEEVLPFTLQVAHELAANTSPASVAYTKSMVNNARESPEKQHLLDSRAMHVLGNSNDGKEGVNSFLERRVPVFEDFDTGTLPSWLARSNARNVDNAGRRITAWARSKL
ncbi:ClpP/crotonase [Ramaria rubella]|nr:ClpP/crotonase [Ramaria rubella]